MKFQYKPCETCPINQTCWLAKSDHAWQCSLNKQYAPVIKLKEEATSLTYSSDKGEDYTKYDGYEEDE